MQSLLTLLGGVSLGAAAMYLLDPDRGDRRRAELRDALEELGDSELVAQARRLEPGAAMRQLGGGVAAARQLGGEVAALVPASWGGASRRRAWRRRATSMSGSEWALLGGFVGVIGAGLWLARRATDSRQGVEVLRTMTVEAPVERVYAFWNDFENFPRFMSHVREVRRTGPDRTRWVVAGPGGTPVEWDAIVTRRTANEEISWRTVEGSLVEHHGTVRFRPDGNSATRIDVRMTYRPIGGAVGHGLAVLLSGDPERVIGEDLARLATQLREPKPAVGESGSWR
jgi:uncharacterized membrane protein